MCSVGWCCGVALWGGGCGVRWAGDVLWGVLWGGGGGRGWPDVFCGVVLWGGGCGMRWDLVVNDDL